LKHYGRIERYALGVHKDMKKVKIQITSWLNGSVLFEYEKEDNTLRDTVLEAVRRYANLRYANLSSADLSYANLRYANLSSADLSYADLSYANLSSADLSYANLRYANLSYADLSYANLRYADLRYANLSSADLSYANLSSADLSYAKNLPMLYRDNLAILQFQKHKLIAYKYLNADWGSPIQGNRIFYKIGETIEEKDCNTDIFQDCGSGLNVATLDWCLRDTGGDLDKIYIEVEFDPKDIAAIPYSTDGKFRVKKLKVLRKLTKRELKKQLEVVNKE
jgi:hypothetical protein